MWSSLLVLACGVSLVRGEKTSSNGDKKRGLYDESYPGAPQGMLIRTHFAAEGKSEDRPRYALLSAYPVAQIAKYAPSQRFIVLSKVPAGLPSAPIPSALPYGLTYQQEAPVYSQQAPVYPQQAPVYPQQAQLYPQQAQLYPTLPYQVKMQYATGRYPYTYAPQVRYYVPKRFPLVTEDTLDYQRPPIDERSAYQLSPPLQKPGLPVEEPALYMPKHYYIQTAKEVYPEPKPIAYAIQVPDQQISVQKPIYLPVIDKNIQ